MLKKYRFSHLIHFCLLFNLAVGQQKEPTITLHAEESKLSRVLSAITEMSGYNIVTGPSVSEQDQISIHLEDVPVEQAINLVVRAAGLSYEIVGRSILVAHPNKLKNDIGISPVVFDLKYANANEISNLLNSITDNITIDSTGNRILISASPKKIAEIKHIILEVDTPSVQISLQARIIEVTYGKAENLGIDWARLSSITTILAENPYSELFGTSSSTYPGSKYAIDEDGNLYNWSEGSLPLDQLPDQPFQDLTSSLGGMSRQLSAFDVTIDMLLKDNQAEILANSEVVTLNGHLATLYMLDIVPYILSSGGVGGQVQVQREEVGIKLQILPTVNSDGYITTEVTPEVSSIYDFIGPDRNIPWVKKRVSTTTVRVKDRESIIIAGLLGATRTYSENRFPFLWRIPFFGKRFFIHRTEKEIKTDLIIEITPKIIKDSYSSIEKQQYHYDVENKLMNIDEEKDGEKNDGEDKIRQSDETETPESLQVKDK